MFTRRAGVGSIEARRAGANGARIEARRAGAEARIEGQSRDSQGVRRLEDAALSFYSTCTIPYAPLSALCRCRSGYGSQILKTCRKKGCAYDQGALNKQGALKNQTLRYSNSGPCDLRICTTEYRIAEHFLGVLNVIFSVQFESRSENPRIII